MDFVVIKHYHDFNYVYEFHNENILIKLLMQLCCNYVYSVATISVTVENIF